jgi:hypothetical protein
MTEENRIIDEAPKGAAAPKASAGKADALQKAGDWEDLGPAVVRPTDKLPDAAKKQKKDKTAPTKGAPSPEPQDKVKEDKEKKEGLPPWLDKDKKNGNDKEDDDEKKEQDDDKKKNGKNGEEEDDVEEAKITESRPKTKSGMIQAMYDKLNLMKKADISAKFDRIVAQFGDDEGEDEKDDDEKDAEAASAAEKKEAVEKRVKDIDVKDDVEALVKGDSSLSDEFKQKAATIFEAAVKSKVKAEIERLEGEYATELTESKKEVRDLLVTKVDNYLNYVVEEWMKDNELAIEKGLPS